MFLELQKLIELELESNAVLKPPQKMMPSRKKRIAPPTVAPIMILREKKLGGFVAFDIARSGRVLNQ
jgi:hypothetical protein